jgi:hypothetical protein
MAELILDLLGSALGGIVPKRPNEIIVALILVIVAVSFAGIAAFSFYQGVQYGAGAARVPSVLFGLAFLGLAALSLTFARKGFRGNEERRNVELR